MKTGDLYKRAPTPEDFIEWAFIINNKHIVMLYINSRSGWTTLEEYLETPRSEWLFRDISSEVDGWERQ
tara:strand:+ start:18604 stop:18810 length:207 start_codon:yes stop_codon:yes gene_type:complete